MFLLPPRVVLGARHARVISRFIQSLPVQRSFHSSARALMSTIDKDLPTPVQLTPVQKLYSNDTDILLEQLRKARHVERVLELVSLHLDIMNNKHVVTSFNCISDLIIRERGNDMESDLVKNETFQSLCHHVMNRARYLAPDEVIVVYKTLCRLNIPCNTYVMQSMLKMLCSQINDLSLSQLTFLNFLLSKHRPNPLADSLKLALPLVLQVQIDQQLDGENFNETVSCLQMACKAKLRASTIEKIVSSLQKRSSEFTPEQASNVVFSLLLMGSPIEGYMQLIKSSFQVVTNNIHLCQPSLLLTLTRLCQKQSFYYASFFSNLCKRVITERWPLPELYELTSRLHKLGFFSSELIDLLCEEIIHNARDITENPKYSILTLSESLSFVDHRPPQIATAVDVLSSSTKKVDLLLRSFPFLYLKLISCWAMLGYFDSRFIQKILNENFLYSAWSSSKKHGRSVDFELHVCCLQWALEVHDRLNEFPFPQSFMNEIYRSVLQKHSKPTEFPLSKFIESGLGGEQFFKNGVFTTNGHFIDHIVAMRNGNYPVSLNSINLSNNQQQCFVEDIPVSDDTKIVAILVAKEDHFCMDPEILKGYMSLKVKSLKKLSLYPVVVNYDSWYNLPDREKIPYLMREIKLATGTNGDIQDLSTVLPS